MANRSGREAPSTSQTRGTSANRSEAEPVEGALAVLRHNAIGAATSPSRRLYPHQWSWDSACIAIGYARADQERAQTELRSLFAGQWRNGLLPHIVFSEGARYFPGPEFWQTERSPDAPARPRTSGIVQPAVHGTALWEVVRHAADRDRADAFARELLPRMLVAWHEYLYRERTRDGGALVEVWHPWETGMDNSPLWDDALARIEFAPERRARVHARRRPRSQWRTSGRATASTTGTRTSSGCSATSGTTPDGSASRRRSRSGPSSSTRSSSSRIATWPSSRGRRRRRRPARGLGRADRGPRSRSSGTTPRASTATSTSARASRWRPGAPRGSLRCTRRSRRPQRAARMLETVADAGVAVGSDGWAATSLPPGGPSLRAHPVLAGPRLADPELGPPARARALRLRPARRAGPHHPRLARARRRLLGALRPDHAQRPRRRAVRVDRGARARPRRLLVHQRPTAARN